MFKYFYDYYSSNNKIKIDLKNCSVKIKAYKRNLSYKIKN